MDGPADPTGAPPPDGRQLLALEAQKLAGEAGLDRRRRIATTLSQGWQFLQRCHALPDLEREGTEPRKHDDAEPPMRDDAA